MIRPLMHLQSFMTSLRHVRTALIALLFSVVSGSLGAQTLALRTNALLWGAEAANLSFDFTASESSTIGVTALFTVADSWIHHTRANGCQLEYRYWFTHQPFHSLFVGPVAGVFHYRVDEDLDTQYAFPVGLQCGYAWTLSRHFNVEANYGVGYLYYNRAHREPVSSPVLLDGVGPADYDLIESHHHKFTTINLGLSIVYVF